MSMLLPALLARPLVQVWLNISVKSWRRRVIAADSPQVHSPGVNADRVLITGDGVATGRGVLTHDLGLPGHLARSLSARTGNAADVDVVVDQDMTVRTCSDAIAVIDLLRYDVIVLSLGHNEALCLLRPSEWERQLRALLTMLDSRVAAATEVFILPVPVFGPRSPLPEFLARPVDAHAHALNEVTSRLAAAAPHVSLIWGTDATEFQPETTHMYRVWADGISTRIAQELEQDRIPAGEMTGTDEEARQRAVRKLRGRGRGRGAGTDPTLDRLTESARRSFGAPIAAITLIHENTQTMAAVTGMDRADLPREETFCDVTIRRARHLVIEDAEIDSRYAHYSVVTGATSVRAYAGYPIESPDGHRVGAVCVMDTKPRRFTHHDIELLRTLALLAQDHLWGDDAQRVPLPVPEAATRNLGTEGEEAE